MTMSFTDKLIKKIKDSRWGIAEIGLAIILIVEGFSVAYVDNLEEVHVIPLWLRLTGHFTISVIQMAFGMAMPQQLYQAVIATINFKKHGVLGLLKEWVEAIVTVGLTIWIPLVLMGIIANGLGEYEIYSELGFLRILWNQNQIQNSTLVWTCLNMTLHFSVIILVGINQIESLQKKQSNAPSPPTSSPVKVQFNPTDWHKMVMGIAKKYRYEAGKTMTDSIMAIKSANDKEKKWLGTTPDEDKLAAFLAYKKIINPNGALQKEINQLENLT